MKPFNLEQAKAGAAVCTRDGLAVRILCYDSKSAECKYPIVALIRLSEQREKLEQYQINGRYGTFDCIDDLMMED